MSDYIKSLSKGTKWTMIDKVGNQLLKFIVLMVLARLLTPSDFGIIAVATFFILISESFVKSGITHAFINLDFDEDEGFSSLVCLNLITAFIFCFLLYFLSDYIEKIYDVRDISLLLKFYSPIIIIDALYSSYLALSEKKLNFKLVMYINLPAFIFASLIGIYSAYKGYSYWSIIAQLFVYKSLMLSFIYFINRKTKVSLKSVKVNIIKSYFQYGWKLQLSALINVFSKEINSFIIGANIGVTEAGLYARVNNLQLLVVQTAVLVIEKVSFPLLSKIKDNEIEVLKNTRLTNKLFSIAIYPILFALFISSKETIHILFGENWIKASGIFQCLILSGLVRFMQSPHLTYLKVRGYTALILKLRVTEAIVTIISLYIGYNWGMNGIVISAVFSSYASYIIIAILVSKISKYSIFQQVSDAFPFFIIVLALSISSFTLFGWIYDDTFITAFYSVMVKSAFIIFPYIIFIRFSYKKLLNLSTV